MVIQYDSKSDSWSNNLSLGSPEYKQGKKFFQNYATNHNGTSLQTAAANAKANNTYTGFVKNLNLADGALKEFMNDSEYAEKSLTNFQAYLKQTGQLSGTLSKTIKGLGSAFANMAVGMAVGVAVDLIITGFVKLIKYSENARKASKELTDEWKNNDSSLQSSIDKYTELNDKLNDSNLSVENYMQVKKELSSLQDELTEKYGQEAKGIDLLTGSYDIQLQKIKELRATEAQEYINKNQAGIEATRKFINDERQVTLTVIPLYRNLANTEETQNRRNKSLEFIRENGIEFNDNTGEPIITGTREEIRKKLNEISTSVEKNSNFSQTQIKNIKQQISEVLSSKQYSTELDEQLKTWEEYSQAAATSGNSSYGGKTSATIYDEYKNAIDTYNTALASGNDKQIAETKQTLDNVKKDVDGITGVAEDTKNAFDNVTDSINKSGEAAYNMRQKIAELKTDGLKDSNDENISFDESISSLKGATNDDLLKYIENAKSHNGNWQFGDLENINLSPEQQHSFADLATNLGLTADNAYLAVDELVKLKAVIRSIGNATDSEKLSNYFMAQAQNAQAMQDFIASGQQIKFGNVDLTKRPTIYWNDQELKRQIDALETLNGYNGFTDDQIKADLKDTTSTVLGESAEFNGVEIAFTPIIDDGTGHGKVLDKDTLNDYIQNLVDEATDDSGNIDFEKLLKLDAKGVIENDGTKIKNVIADIGDTAKNTGEKMHDSQDGYVAVAKAFDDINNAAKQSNLTIDLWIQKAKKAKFGDIFSLKDSEGKTNTTLGNLSENLDQIQTAYSTITGVMKKYNEEGYITVDGLKSILAMGDQYLQYLVDENGNLVSDTESLKQLTLARINEMEAQALNNLTSSLDQIKSEEDAQTYLATSLNDTASSCDTLTASTIAAKLAMSGLTAETQDAVIDQVLAQQERIKSLFEKVRAGVNNNFSLAMSSDKDSNSSADAADKAADALDTYNKKVKDINKSLSDLDKEEHLSELKYTIEQIAVDLDRFKNTLDSLDSKLDLTFENDFAAKLNTVNEQLSTATKYGSEMRTEMERLIGIQPQTGDEAEELASQLESLSQEFFENRKNILKYRDEMYNTTLEFVSASGESMVNQVKNAKSVLDNSLNLLENGSLSQTGFWSNPLLPSVSKDKVQQQREENNKLIAEEQRYQDEITKIRKRANEMQKADKDKERDEKRADYAQQLEDAKGDYNRSLSSANRKSKNKSYGSNSNKSNASEGISESVNGKTNTYTDATTEIINTVKSADFINSLSSALSDSFTKAFEQSKTSVHDVIMNLLLQNSVWDELPNALTTKLSEVLGIAKSTWDTWISQPENALQAVSLARDNNIGSWDLLRDNVKHFLEDTGIIGVSAWNELVENNPLQAFALLIASWDAMRDLVQQYMNDTIQIVQNGADAITNTQINAPSITEDSWNNLQTLIANKIQEILNVINETFGNTAVDLNFNVGLNGPAGDAETSVSNSKSGVLQAAHSQEGYSPGINGVNKFSGWIYNAQGGIAQPWCADFVSWCLAQAGYGHIRSSSVDGLRSQVTSHPAGSYTPQPGDLAMRGSEHVEIVDHIDSDGNIWTIGGNTGNGEVICHQRNNWTDFGTYSTGTTNAVGGQALVGDEYLTKGTSFPTPELVLSPTSRRAYLAGVHGAEMLNLHSGDVVVPYSETKKLLANGTLNSIGDMGAFAKGTKGFANKISSLFGKKNQNNDSANSNQLTGTRIDVPDGLGYVTTYMHWTSITSPDSLQYKLRQDSGAHYIGDYATVNGRNVLAMTDTFGWVGDYVDVYLSDGRIINGIIGDIKDQTWAHGTPANHWGHYDGKNVVEFVMRPGYNGDNPSLNGARAAYVVNLGNYWGNPTFAGSTFNSGTSLLSTKLQEIYNKMQSLMGTFKTSTKTTAPTVASYKSLGNTRGSYGFDVPFTKRENGGWTPANTIVQTNEAGQEATIDKNGNIVPIGDGSPQVIVSDHDFPVINAKDYAAIKKYGGDKTSVKFLEKGNTSIQTANNSEENDKDEEKIEDVLNDIKSFLGKESLKKTLEETCSIDELKALRRVTKYLDTDEKITEENLETFKSFAKNTGDLLEKIQENSLDEILKQYDDNFKKEYLNQQKLEKATQADFKKSFDKYLKNATGENWNLDYDKIAQKSVAYSEQALTLQTLLTKDTARNKINELQPILEALIKASEDAPTATIQQQMIDKANEVTEQMQTINEDFTSAMESLTEFQLSIITERDQKFLSALSYLDKDINSLQEALEDATSVTENVQGLLEINSSAEQQIKIQRQRQTNAHANVQNLRNSDDESIRWVFEHIKIDEIFDADNEFNNKYNEQIKMLTTMGYTEYIESFKYIAALVQASKKIYTEADDSIKQLTKTISDNNKEVKNQKIDTYVSLLERKSQILDYVYEKQQLLIDAESTTNEILQNLRDQRRDYTAELRANKDLSQWLDADTRALLFNEDDYSEMMSTMDGIQSEVLKNQQWYRREIAKLDENDLYHQELITEQYTKRNEQLQEELETAQQRLDVAKKTAEYYNIAKERDTQIIMGNRMVNVANPESLYNAAMEKTKAETLLSDTLKNNAENQAVRDKQIENAKIQDESSGYQAMVSAINELSDAERKAFADFLPPIERIEATLKAVWKTDQNWIIRKGLALDKSSNGLVLDNKGLGYDSSYDYQAAKELVEKMDLPNKVKEQLYNMLDEKHGLKDANFANNKYTSDTTYEDNILPENTPLRYADSVNSKKKKNVKYSYDTDYSLILDEIAQNIAEHGGVYTGDYDPALIEGLQNRKLFNTGLEYEQTNNYGGFVFSNEPSNVTVAKDELKRLLDASNSEMTEKERIMVLNWGDSVNDMLKQTVDIYAQTNDTIKETNKLLPEVGKNLALIVGKHNTATTYQKLDSPNLAIGDINKYATGTQSAKSGIANVDEEGFEYKLRKVNGDKYIPLNDGDIIFPFKATENLWNIANNSQNWLEGQLRGMGMMNNTSNINSVANNINNRNTSYNINGDIVVNEASNVSDIIQGMTDIIATQDQNHSNMEV